MPYINEYADKSSHSDIVRNPDVQDFLNDCKYMIEPHEDSAGIIKDLFLNVEEPSNKLPENIISIDGTNYEACVRKDIPSTRVGFVKVGNLLIKRNMFNSLQNGGRFINPFKVAEIKENNQAATFTFPSSNIRFGEEKSVRDGFRLALENHLNNYRSDTLNPKTSLRTTLFKLASYRNSEHSSGDVIIIHKCPTCGEENVHVYDIPEQQYCPHCNKKVYPTDCLRIWEAIGDNVSNQVALTRFMNSIEHLFVVHYIRVIVDTNPQSFAGILQNLCFFVDGPLAIFGNAAWLNGAILKYFDEINQELRKLDKSDIMLIGLLKSGEVHDYFQMISKHVPNGSIYCLEDSVRFNNIVYNDAPPNNFGNETYYGQDFLFKTKNGRIFVFNIPYPRGNKGRADDFKRFKENINNYKNIWMYTKLIEDFECDLYENSVVPIALAHKYTSISLEPGSKVLDLLSKSGMYENGK